jgi:hypothetical protein
VSLDSRLLLDSRVGDDKSPLSHKEDVIPLSLVSFFLAPTQRLGVSSIFFLGCEDRDAMTGLEYVT